MTDPIELGTQLVDQGRYDEAFEHLLPLAIAGNGRAQAEVGCFYQIGVGTQLDRDEAEKWLLKAAEQGVGSAAHNLGTLYGATSPDLAKQWYRRARELGFQVAPDDFYD